MFKKWLIAGAVLTVAVEALAGWQYTAVTKAEGGANARMMGSTTHAWVDGARVKIEFSESGNPLMGAGSYLLSSDGGQKVFLVNPKNKTYSTWDISGMMGMAGGMMEMMNMKFKNCRVEKLLEEKGPALLGQPTTHYRYRTSYTMEMNLMGMAMASDTVKDEDLWITTALKDAGLSLWLNQQNNKTGNEQLDSMISAEMSKARGFPLKNVSTTTTRDNRGQQKVMKMSMEITELKPCTPAAKMFEMPADYHEAQMAPLGSGNGQKKGQGQGGGADNPLLKLMQNMNR